MIALLALLFVLLAALLPVVRAAARHDRRAAVAFLIAAGALFRLLMLPAGLEPRAVARHGGTLSALAADLAGGGSYQPFLLYDNDVYRYLWDGHAAACGVGPYRSTPASLLAAEEDGSLPAATVECLFGDRRWWDVLDNVSFQRHTSVYPPAAQLLFRLAHLLAPGSVLLLKLLLTLCDLATCLLLAHLLTLLGRPPEELLLYAWNPLAIKEIAGSGHVDALAVLLLTLTALLLVEGRHRLGMAALAGGVLAKLAPLLLLPLALRFAALRFAVVRSAGLRSAGLRSAGLRSDSLRGQTAAGARRPAARHTALLLPVFAGVLAAGCLPYLAGLPELARGLAVFGRDWVFNAGPFYLLAALGEPIARWLAAGLAVALAGTLALRVPRGGAGADTRAETVAAGRDLVWRGFVILAALTLLSPAVMPWYLLWALPLAIAAGRRSWVLLGALSLLSYLVYAERAEHGWWLWIEYGLFTVAALVESRRAAVDRAIRAPDTRAPDIRARAGGEDEARTLDPRSPP